MRLMIELILFSRESDSYRYYMYVCGQALVLLTEVRGMLVSLLLPHHGKLKEKIEEVLDVELIKQQIDTGVLEFEKYAGYIIGRTLCPSRLRGRLK